MSVENLQTLRSSDVPDLRLRLRRTLASCSHAIEADDFGKSEESISQLLELLNSVSESVPLDPEPENEESERMAFEFLTEIHSCITSSSMNQAVMDALSFDLPKAAAQFSCASQRCMDLAETVIDQFLNTCSPRDMLSILCEALGSPKDKFQVPGYFAPLLGGIAKVFVSIQRRPFEQIKAAVPVIVKVLEVMSSEPDDAARGFKDLFGKAISIATSIQALCVNMEGENDKKLSAVLGLFVLQVTALSSIAARNEVSGFSSLVLELSNVLRYCGFSSLGLITGSEVDSIAEIVSADDVDDCASCFSYVRHGAAIVVVWCHASEAVPADAKADLARAINELQSDRTKRWQAVGMLKHLFASANLPLKKNAVSFLLSILEGSILPKDDDADMDALPSLFSALQAVQMVIVYAADAQLRKRAFNAFRMVIADIPTSQRFEILVALINNGESSSMIAILLDIVRDEMHMEIRQSFIRNGVRNPENSTIQYPSFWRSGVLDLVVLVLRPPKGGPPSLPDYSDAVLSALNLYRFVLITESSGKTNRTGALSKESLQRAYDEWLQPLRNLVAGITAETQKDFDQLASDTMCALNPVQLVLYRCIELVEECLKHAS